MKIFLNKFIYYLCIYLFIYGCVAACGLSLVAASGSYSSLLCAGFWLWCLLLLRSTGSRCAGSVVVARGLSCYAACGIFPDQGSNPCPLCWQANSQPLRHQGSPLELFFNQLLRYNLHTMKLPVLCIQFFLIYFIFGCVWSSSLCVGFLSCGEQGLLFVAVPGLLIAVASLVVEHWL